MVVSLQLLVVIVIVAEWVSGCHNSSLQLLVVIVIVAGWVRCCHHGSQSTTACCHCHCSRPSHPVAVHLIAGPPGFGESVAAHPGPQHSGAGGLARHPQEHPTWVLQQHRPVHTGRPLRGWLRLVGHPVSPASPGTEAGHWNRRRLRKSKPFVPNN